MIGAKRCRCCRGWIGFDTETQQLRHSEPVCVEFTTILQVAGLSHVAPPSTNAVDVWRSLLLRALLMRVSMG